ncbi:MAG: biotin--[acetyl-CoA-carboxylase] ligase [Bacteroidia bacterium]|nr:biotin--[acetyl-CoA-carboxylase] ligase [Bacteroidia bacterium]
MYSKWIGTNSIKLKSVDSTNKYAAELAKQSDVPDGTVIIAQEQKQGRGQGNSSWESEKNKNLTFSIVLYPVFLKSGEQFYLSKAISLGIADFLNQFTNNVSIKWPNDIYIENRKVCGILIENFISENQFSSAIIGIGLNINQTKFKGDAPNPVSLKQVTGINFNIDECLGLLLFTIENRYEELQSKKFSKIDKEYDQSLYRYKISASYKTGKKTIKARITGVNNRGLLMLETAKGNMINFGFKEVEFV